MTEGTMIADRYRIEGRLGLGGMSTVHLALDTRLERHVAIKLLAEHLADDPTFVSRFQREALAAARLVHPNVVQVFDSGLDEASGRHFIVMEYVPGQSVAQILRDRGGQGLGVEETLAIVVQACHGLDYAHRQGVVHRDVKPGNLLRSPDGIVKLADFGIARATDQSSITQVGSVLGTAAYLSPEQAAGEEAGPQADLYSLGVVTYQCLAGRLPYEAQSLSELVLKQQREAPPRLDQLRPDVSPALARAVAVALSIDPRDRYATAREMGDALDRAAEAPPEEPTAATRALGATEATSVLPASAAVASAPAWEPAGEAPVAPRQPVPRRRQPPPAPAPPPAAPRPRPRRARAARVPGGGGGGGAGGGPAAAPARVAGQARPRRAAHPRAHRRGRRDRDRHVDERHPARAAARRRVRLGRAERRRDAPAGRGQHPLAPGSRPPGGNRGTRAPGQPFPEPPGFAPRANTRREREPPGRA
ncbi:MAG: serine/threonine protein kinase, partial [Solirubrobacteraceae bacterium]|nr:serine/threonine protein kinase [Solirubrobacteraceae bacterium]